ncbi:MAG TPA: glycosyltransferase family 2 protein [Mycobacteriales bacterium]|nr:glycosyltransferase family 2 protein [Mycobacteriales bacterium]
MSEEIHRSLREAADTKAVTDAALREFRSRYPDIRWQPLVIVIAAYNEEDGVGEVLEEIPSDIAGVGVTTLVVDDGSRDATGVVSSAHGALVCRLPVNRGHGVALRVGYQTAREAGARYIATLDADGQWDPADLPAMIKLLEDDQADFVIGSRQLGQTHNTDKVRNTGVTFFAWLISRLTGTTITDSSSGLRAMRAEITGTVRQTQPQYQTSELLIGSIYAGYRIAEVPTTMRERSFGESRKGRNASYALRYASVIARTWLRERRSHPSD